MVPFRRPGLVLPLAGVALSLGAQEAYSIPDSEEEALKALVALFNTPVESASKRSQKSLESPQAIEVLSGDQIRASGVFRLHDLLKLMTNVQVWEVDYQSTWVGMRGVSPNGAPHNVQVLLDGVPLYNAEVFSVDVDDLPIPIDAIDRVEVVRGPSSSLYGANAQVGVISILTKRAKDGSTGSLRASAAEGGTFHNQGFYGFGSSGFHFTTGFGGYSVRDSDHTLRAIAGTRTVEHQDQGHGSQVFLRPEATFAGGKFWAMYAKGSKLYAPQTAESLTGVLLYQFSHLSGSAEVAQVGWSQTWSPALRSEVKLNRDHSTIGFGPISVIPGSPTSAFVVPFLLSLDPGLGADYDLADFKNEQLAIQINWDPSEKLHFVFGGDSSRLRGGKAPIIGLKAEQTEHATGGFLSMDWELGAATLSLGARAENESLGGSRISPRIAGVYALGGNAVLRAGYFTSTRSPQMTETRAIYNPPGQHSLIANPGLKPEETDNFEVGYRKNWARWSLDLTLYRMKLKKLIAQVPTGEISGGEPVTQFRNGDAEPTNRGLEASLTGELGMGWLMGLNAATVDFKDESAGGQADNAPKVSSNLWTRYRKGFFQGYLALQYSDSYYRRNVATQARERSGNRFQVHFNLSVEPSPGAQFSLYGINAARGKDEAASSLIASAHLVQYSRREWGIQARYRF